MNRRTIEVENNAIANALLDLDVEPLVERIWNDAGCRFAGTKAWSERGSAGRSIGTRATTSAKVW